MKKTLHLFITLLCIHTAQANTTDSIAKAKQCFSDAHSQISQMLEGKEPLNYEKAIFLTENAFYQNAVNYDDYKAVLDYHTRNITAIAEANRNDENIKHNNNPLLSKEEKQELYNNVLYNWAIYTYLTDTTFFVDTTGIYFHLPYSYSKADPYGKNNFSNTQTIGLLIPQLRTGNCYALATLYKIFSERLHTNAQLATAPGHIYIRHCDINGTWYNVEPATGSFPGTGTISTVTYTTDKAIETGIALRTLNQEESINLCMIYLAKGYENKFKEAHSSFAMQCAETALKYDAKNLNAMLLKAEILESKLLASNKTVAQLQSNATFKEYESLLTQLHALGYKQMPEDMRKYITATIQGDSTALPPIGDPQASGYASLSKGFLVEDITENKTEQYNHTLYNTKTNRITGFTPTKQEDVDVVFALSVDPLAMGYPFLSPYNFSANSPILLKDADGRVIIVHYMDEKKQQQTVVLEKVSDIETYLNDNNNFVRAVAKNLKKINDSGVPTVADAIECTKETVHIYYKKQINGSSNLFFEKGKVDANSGKLYEENTILFDPGYSTALFSDEVISNLSELAAKRRSPNTTEEMGIAIYNQMQKIKKNAKVIGYQSPDEILDHELNHFLGFIENPEKFKEDVGTSDALYDTKEEKRVQQGPEKDYRGTKGLPERTNHGTIREKGKSENLKIDKNGKNMK